ncbi:unnamed protein product [Hermetia illucens]|uniref:UDP-N-acetylglucosamine transferase subunit ALG13 n=1 Tax=Hermetia illucens TaxID=343691 RepID=A0A7R8UPA5_HERIL|nr:UDP-N-acetylglucosamine transferase subunit ALG13 homolog [Hermetia illucens]CAD7084290.1 unnamed protein product [Hermetia illucens]
MKSFNTVFVTVGTTRFDSMVDAVCSSETLQTLHNLGCTRLIVQYGAGDESSVHGAKLDGINVESYRLKPSITEDIQKADLVISHAGAGSCLEVLKENKPLVVVINDELMGNHQIELAEQLHLDGNLFYCSPQDLRKTLTTCDFDGLKPYHKGDMTRFVHCLDELMGFK